MRHIAEAVEAIVERITKGHPHAASDDSKIRVRCATVYGNADIDASNEAEKNAHPIT